MMDQAVSVIVRSHNDIAFIKDTLSMLANQTLTNIELISVDDFSTDGTEDVIQSFSPPVLLHPQRPYFPGRNLNQAIAAASSPIIVFNNSDSVPLDSDYLEKLIQPLLLKPDDPGFADIVFANQEPRENASPLVRKDNERAFGDGKISAKWDFFFSLASSATRRELLLANPFDETLRYSEDVEWAYRMKKAGRIIRYVPEARVEHSHNYSRTELWKRFYNEGVADATIFPEKKGSTLHALRQAAMESIRDFFYLCRTCEFEAMSDIIPRRFIQRFAYTKGFREARTEQQRLKK